MDAETLLYGFYVLAMALGALVFTAWAFNPRGVHIYEYAVAIFIPVWSGLAYLSMAFNQGQLQIDNQTTYYARYLDWVVTTPLLLLALSFTAMHYVKKNKTLIAGLMGADVVMILSGLIADLSPTPLRYVWYLIGVVAFLVILWLIWNPLRAIADSQGPDLARIFRRVAGLLSVLWVAYPAVWLLGPSGIGLIGQTWDTALFVFVPIISKVGWSFFDLRELRSLKAVEQEAPRLARA
jgi:bacteriorhodopsin